MSKIIKPEGIELIKYRNEGYIICNKCGALMDLVHGEDSADDIFLCPACGWSVDTMEYQYEYDEGECIDVDDGSMPVGCMACGGPYPDCTISCPLFD